MTTTPAIPRPRTPSEARHNSPPRAASVLAVTARPGQESADLGGLLYAFRRSGASLSLLSLTRGGAPVGNAAGRLHPRHPPHRGRELPRRRAARLPDRRTGRADRSLDPR